MCCCIAVCLLVFTVIMFALFDRVLRACVRCCFCGRTSRSFSFRLLHSAYVYVSVSVSVSVFIVLAFLFLCCVSFCFVLFYFSLLLANPG